MTLVGLPGEHLCRTATPVYVPKAERLFRQWCYTQSAGRRAHTSGGGQECSHALSRDGEGMALHIKRKSWGYHGGGIGNLRGRTYRQKLLTQNGSGRSGQ
jgi:hypothetical protein